MKISDDQVDLVCKLLVLWSGVNDRCNRPKARSYKDYGAKGVTLCHEWSNRQGQIRFVKWCLANGYREGLDIDRINNLKGYSPDNCRFTTRKINCRNKSNNVNLTFEGETKCVSAWGEDPRCPVSPGQFAQRIKAGWSIERAMTQPLRTKNHGKKAKEQRRP